MDMTVKQIAEELGVSKQAVWQRIKRNPELRSAFEQHSRTVNGTVYADEVGVELVRAAYSEDLKAVNVDETAINVDETADSKAVNTVDGELVAALQKTIDTLNEQLAVKDKQIDALTATLTASQSNVEALTTALTAAQALHAGTMQERLTERSGGSDEQAAGGSIEQEERRGFFKRFFGRKDK